MKNHTKRPTQAENRMNESKINRLQELDEIINAFKNSELSKGQYARSICDWYSEYFMQYLPNLEKFKFGLIISPANETTAAAIEHLFNDFSFDPYDYNDPYNKYKVIAGFDDETGVALYHDNPPSLCLQHTDAVKCYSYIEWVLDFIATKWEYAAACALSAKFSLTKLKREVQFGNVYSRAWTNEAERDHFINEYRSIYNSFFEGLNELSGLLLKDSPLSNDTQKETSETKLDGSMENVIKKCVRDELHKTDGERMKEQQRNRAADWLKKEREEGRTHSLVDAARHFYKEITEEKAKGGYNRTDSLLSALNKQAKELGIDSFIQHRTKKPHKNKDRARPSF